MSDPAGIVEIDGSEGEGGGQILRTALSLSIITGRPFHLRRIRAGRRKPGLAPQHLHAVRAARDVSGAQCRGDREGSTELLFEPGPVRPGSYTVDIGTAGAAALVLQTLVFPLALAPGPSDLVIHGGTHVPWSPPFDFLEKCWLPFMSLVGLGVELRLGRAGFYPRGGGRLSARVEPTAGFRSARLTERGRLQTLEIVSAAAGLPPHVRQRQAARALTGARSAGVPPTVQLVELAASSPGSIVAVTAVYEETRVTATALGARGKPAEAVGDEAAAQFLQYFEGRGALDPFMADQILLPLALASGSSEYTTVRVSQHLLTNRAVIARFLERPIDISGKLEERGRVRVG